MEKCRLVFDELILKQLKKQNNETKEILSKMFDKMELIGPLAGNLIDSKLFLYEIKNKHPPIRLYFKHKNQEIYVFEFEMKTSSKKQKKTINKLKRKLKT